MNKRILHKPDGRRLILYGHDPVDVNTAPSPNSTPLAPTAHLRWHPLRSEWVAYAGQRQNRTFLPPADWDPLAPTTDPNKPTELPAGNYEVAVFENLFPTLSPDAGVPPPASVPTMAATGACEVVVFTQRGDTSLGALPLRNVELVIDVWADRYLELGARDDVDYVFEFENRGVEVGVTLQHPHGQIYAYPFVPPVPARELAAQQAHFDEYGRGLFEALIQDEVRDGRRLLYTGDHIVAFVPVCARYPYEVWIAPRRPAPSIAELDGPERADLARALKTVLLKYDGLWEQPFPYLMVFHQAPTDGKAHPEAHFHIEFYPAYRMRGRLKYLAGSEMGAGLFTVDALPEEFAAVLQAVAVAVDAAATVSR